MLRSAIAVCLLAACIDAAYEYNQLYGETNKILEQNPTKRSVCYVAVYSQYRFKGNPGGGYVDSLGWFKLHDLDASLCTDINLGFYTTCSQFADSMNDGKNTPATWEPEKGPYKKQLGYGGWFENNQFNDTNGAVCPDGALMISNDYTPEELKAVFNQWRTKNPSVKILFSVGGWTYTPQKFTYDFSDYNLVQKFANSVASAVEYFGKDHAGNYLLNGVDIDYEFPLTYMTTGQSTLLCPEGNIGPNQPVSGSYPAVLKTQCTGAGCAPGGSTCNPDKDDDEQCVFTPVYNEKNLPKCFNLTHSAITDNFNHALRVIRQTLTDKMGDQLVLSAAVNAMGPDLYENVCSTAENGGHLDYASLMSYDFGLTGCGPSTNPACASWPNSALYKPVQPPGTSWQNSTTTGNNGLEPMEEWSVEGAVDAWLGKKGKTGCTADKLTMGVPLYTRYGGAQPTVKPFIDTGVIFAEIDKAPRSGAANYANALSYANIPMDTATGTCGGAQHSTTITCGCAVNDGISSKSGTFCSGTYFGNMSDMAMYFKDGTSKTCSDELSGIADNDLSFVYTVHDGRFTATDNMCTYYNRGRFAKENQLSGVMYWTFDSGTFHAGSPEIRAVLKGFMSNGSDPIDIPSCCKPWCGTPTDSGNCNRLGSPPTPPPTPAPTPDPGTPCRPNECTSKVGCETDENANTQCVCKGVAEGLTSTCYPRVPGSSLPCGFIEPSGKHDSKKESCKGTAPSPTPSPTPVPTPSPTPVPTPPAPTPPAPTPPAPTPPAPTPSSATVCTVSQYQRFIAEIDALTRADATHLSSPGNAFDKDKDCDAINALPPSLFDTGGALANMNCVRPKSLTDDDPVDTQTISGMQDMCKSKSSDLKTWEIVVIVLGSVALVAAAVCYKRKNQGATVRPYDNLAVEMTGREMTVRPDWSLRPDWSF